MKHNDEVRRFCMAHHPSLFRALALYTGDRWLAEDLAQEVLARAVSDWPRLRQLHSPGAYVYRMAVNLANAHFRRRRIADRAMRRVAVGSAPDADAFDHADVLAVRAAVRALPPRQRAVVVLRFQAGLSLAEIAGCLDVSVGTVKSQLHDALASLRLVLDTQEEHSVYQA